MRLLKHIALFLCGYAVLVGLDYLLFGGGHWGMCLWLLLALYIPSGVRLFNYLLLGRR